MTRKPTLDDLLAADAARARDAADKLPRRGNNPWITPDLYPRRGYPDPTGDRAAARVDRERKRKRSAR